MLITGFAVLLGCQLAGEITVRGLDLPLPGPVVGMVYLVAALAVGTKFTGRDDLVTSEAPIGRAADGLLASLGALFVPAGVGVVQYLGLIGANGVAIAASLVVSTVLALLATVGTFRLVRRRMVASDEESAP